MFLNDFLNDMYSLEHSKKLIFRGHKKHRYVCYLIRKYIIISLVLTYRRMSWNYESIIMKYYSCQRIIHLLCIKVLYEEKGGCVDHWCRIFVFENIEFERSLEFLKCNFVILDNISNHPRFISTIIFKALNIL